MERSQTISVRIEPQLKKDAENVLDELGLSTSSLITLLFKQIVLTRSVPFDISLHDIKPLCIDDLSEEELEKEIMKGIRSRKAGRTKPAKEVEDSIRKRFKL